MFPPMNGEGTSPEPPVPAAMLGVVMPVVLEVVLEMAMRTGGIVPIEADNLEGWSAAAKAGLRTMMRVLPGVIAFALVVAAAMAVVFSGGGRRSQHRSIARRELGV